MEGESGQWRKRKQRILLKHQGKLLSKDEFLYMTANSGNTPSPTSRKLEEEEEADQLNVSVKVPPDLSNLNKGTLMMKNLKDRSHTPPPQVLVEFCETNHKIEGPIDHSESPPIKSSQPKEFVRPSLASIGSQQEERKGPQRLRVAKKGASKQSKDEKSGSGQVLTKKRPKKARATKDDFQDKTSVDRPASVDNNAHQSQAEGCGLSSFVQQQVRSRTPLNNLSEQKKTPVHHNPFKRSLTNEPQEQLHIDIEEKKSISNDEGAGTSNDQSSLQPDQLLSQKQEKRSEFLKVMQTSQNNPNHNPPIRSHSENQVEVE